MISKRLFQRKNHDYKDRQDITKDSKSKVLRKSLYFSMGSFVCKISIRSTDNLPSSSKLQRCCAVKSKLHFSFEGTHLHRLMKLHLKNIFRYYR